MSSFKPHCRRQAYLNQLDSDPKKRRELQSYWHDIRADTKQYKAEKARRAEEETQMQAEHVRVRRRAQALEQSRQEQARREKARLERDSQKQSRQDKRAKLGRLRNVTRVSTLRSGEVALSPRILEEEEESSDVYIDSFAPMSRKGSAGSGSDTGYSQGSVCTSSTPATPTSSLGGSTLLGDSVAEADRDTSAYTSDDMVHHKAELPSSNALKHSFSDKSTNASELGHGRIKIRSLGRQLHNLATKLNCFTNDVKPHAIDLSSSKDKLDRSTGGAHPIQLGETADLRTSANNLSSRETRRRHAFEESRLPAEHRLYYTLPHSIRSEGDAEKFVQDGRNFGDLCEKSFATYHGTSDTARDDASRQAEQCDGEEDEKTLGQSRHDNGSTASLMSGRSSVETRGPSRTSRLWSRLKARSGRMP